MNQRWKSAPAWIQQKHRRAPETMPGLPAPRLKQHRLGAKPFLARNKRDEQVANVRQSAAERWVLAARGNLKRQRSGIGHRAHSKSSRQRARLRQPAFATRTQLRKLKKILPPEMATRLQR